MSMAHAPRRYLEQRLRLLAEQVQRPWWQLMPSEKAYGQTCDRYDTRGGSRRRGTPQLDKVSGFHLKVPTVVVTTETRQRRDRASPPHARYAVCRPPCSCCWWWRTLVGSEVHVPRQLGRESRTQSTVSHHPWPVWAFTRAYQQIGRPLVAIGEVLVMLAWLWRTAGRRAAQGLLIVLLATCGLIKIICGPSLLWIAPTTWVRTSQLQW